MKIPGHETGLVGWLVEGDTAFSASTLLWRVGWSVSRLPSLLISVQRQHLALEGWLVNQSLTIPVTQRSAPVPYFGRLVGQSVTLGWSISHSPSLSMPPALMVPDVH